MDIKEWAGRERQVQQVLAREAGLTSTRSYHDGIAAVCAMVHEAKDAALLLAQVVEPRGTRGIRGVEGIRHGLAMVEGARSLLAASGDETVAAWRAEA